MLAARYAGEPRQRHHARPPPRRHAATPGRKAGNPRPGIPAPRCRARRRRARAQAVAMRGPSRQTTASEIAGGLARDAMARARSASTRPSAPSAMPASVSGRPGESRSAGDLASAGGTCAIYGFGSAAVKLEAGMKVDELVQHRGVVLGRHGFGADDPGIERRHWALRSAARNRRARSRRTCR